jgi:hypothetical protein
MVGPDIVHRRTGVSPTCAYAAEAEAQEECEADKEYSEILICGDVIVKLINFRSSAHLFVFTVVSSVLTAAVVSFVVIAESITKNIAGVTRLNS